MNNLLLGDPKTKERSILLLVPLVVTVFLFGYILEYIARSDINTFEDFMSTFFINSDMGINFVSYLSLIMVYLWWFFKIYVDKFIKKYPVKTRMSFGDKFVYQLTETLMRSFSIVIFSGLFFYILGRYALYLQFKDTVYLYNITITVLFFGLFFVYIWRDYLRLKNLLLGVAGYHLILSGQIYPPEVKIMLKNNSEVTGLVVPPYTDKNAMVLLSQEQNNTKRVLKYVPWDEILYFEIHEDSS